QAEDGIRDRNVTGVQTCALPIWAAASSAAGRQAATSPGRCEDAAQMGPARPGRVPATARHAAGLADLTAHGVLPRRDHPAVRRRDRKSVVYAKSVNLGCCGRMT